MKKFIITLCILLFASPVWGETYCVSESGDGSVPTSMVAATCWDLSDFAGAGGTLAAGDTVVMVYAGGTIVGIMTPPAVDGTLGNEITITIDTAGTEAVPNIKAVAPNARAINLNSRSNYIIKGIDTGDHMFIDGDGVDYCITTANGDNVQIQYVDAFNTAKNPVNGVNQTNLLISDSHLYESDADGIYMEGDSSFKAERLKITDINNDATLGDCIQITVTSNLTGSDYGVEIIDSYFEKDTDNKNTVFLAGTGVAVLVTDSVFVGPGLGVYDGGLVIRSAGFEIKRNIFSNSTNGIFLSTASGIGKIVNNIMLGCTDGIEVSADSSTELSVHNNTFYLNTYSLALVTGTSATLDFTNNISVIDSNPDRHINDPDSLFSGSNNNYYPEHTDCFQYGAGTPDTLADWQTATSSDANSIASDPQFIHPVSNNFRLRHNSPAIDAGILLPHHREYRYAAADVLYNGDMEVDTLWIVVGGLTGEQTDARKYAGTYSWMLTADEAADLIVGYSSAAVIQGYDYVYSFYAYPTTNTAIYLYIEYEESFSGTNPWIIGPIDITADEWNYRAYTIAAPVTSRVALAFVATEASTFYLDNVSVLEMYLDTGFRDFYGLTKIYRDPEIGASEYRKVSNIVEFPLESFLRIGDWYENIPDEPSTSYLLKTDGDAVLKTTGDNILLVR